MAQHCRQLTQLDVSESQRVTAAGVGQLGKVGAARVEAGLHSEAPGRAAALLLGLTLAAKKTAGRLLSCLAMTRLCSGLCSALHFLPAWCCQLHLVCWDSVLTPGLRTKSCIGRREILGPPVGVPPHPPCPQLPALLELNLGWNIRLRDCWLEGLPPCLTRLDLSFCGELTDGALRHLGARLPGLASVTLRKCGRITEAVRGHWGTADGCKFGWRASLRAAGSSAAACQSPWHPPERCGRRACSRKLSTQPGHGMLDSCRPARPRCLPRLPAGPVPPVILHRAVPPGPVALPAHHGAGAAAPAARPGLARPRRRQPRAAPALHGAAGRAAGPAGGGDQQQAPGRRLHAGGYSIAGGHEAGQGRRSLWAELRHGVGVGMHRPAASTCARACRRSGGTPALLRSFARWPSLACVP